MGIKIALAGNPNSGKTTLFNDLTGSNQYVGNWPGVTVEKKDGLLKGHKDVTIQDLPGIYSLSPYSLEERVSRKYLVEERPDAILDIVDGTNIERNLYLTTQLAELGLPMVVAVNMMDLVDKAGDRIDFAKLGKALNCKVVGISATKGQGCADAAQSALEYAAGGRTGEVPHVFTGEVEHAIAHIEESIQGKVPQESIRWYAIKIFERDKDAIAGLELDPELLAHVEEHIKDCEKELEDDAESIITAQRYAFIQKLMDKCVKKNEALRKKVRMSDRIDRIVTNRILAIPVFVVALLAMYWLAVAENGPGTVLTDWANDGLLGDGWFLPWSQHDSAKEGSAYFGMSWDDASDAYAKPAASVEAFEGAFDDPEAIDEASAADTTVEAWLEDEETGEILEDDDGNPEKWTVGYADYLAAKAVEEPEPGDFGVWIPGIAALMGELCEKCGISEGTLPYALINDGIVGGVCTVLGFVPVIAIVFLFLAFLEDCGYMARVAFIMDRLFRSFGLSGKSFIPMLVGKGCGVPAVMAARTIENVRDQRMTVILATFIPCGAKTVIIAMFSAVFFREWWWVAAAMDLLGIAIIVLGGIALKKTRAFAGEAAPFIMELPAYHMPTFRNIVIHTWTRVKAYAIKAGVVIFPCCVVLTLMMTFGWRFQVVDDIADSILATVGGWLAWLTAPLGFGTWQGAAASLSAEIAKEQATATLAMVAGGDGSAAANILAMFKDWGGADYKAVAFSFMLFNLFIPPCIVAVVNTFKEMGTRAWGWFAVGFQMFVGYLLALNAYQFGRLATSGAWGVWTAVAVAADLWVLWMIFRPMPKALKEAA
ncbi:MAG: ferrous iron transporter B [Kiritimatiellae bacterium]|nr:ferrous iron transporter B [Kiritimatiellia bacterium]